MINEPLLQRLHTCNILPTLPTVAIQLIDLVNNPATNLAQISECVAYDPALAFKILKVANSPLYSTRCSATNIRQAVNLMGTHATVTVALSFLLIRTFCDADSSAHQLGFWKRSILSALSCRLLSERFDFNQDDLLVAGLLQNIGMLVLRTAFPEKYLSIATLLNEEAIRSAEKERFGAGHDEVGYWLLKKWRFPDYLAFACVAGHGAPPENATMPSQEGCVAVSGYFADVFLNHGDTHSVYLVTDMARRWLGMDADVTTAVLEKMGACTKEFESLFEVSLIEVDQVEEIVAQAKELIMIADLGRLRVLEESAQRDALTGVHNRSYFNSEFEREFEASTKYGSPLAIAFIDVDHFKRVNDSYGHAAGDSALISLSRLISSQIRNSDIFARYGGEEFVVLFPGTSMEAAWNVLTRIKETIASFVHTFSAESFNLTISIGLAAYEDATMVYESPAEVLHAADRALYEAKSMGRNRIIKAQDDAVRICKV